MNMHKPFAGGATNLEGRIDVRLTLGNGRVTGVDIHSSRPQLAQRLMAGRTPEEAADLAGLIFSLCGQAQRAAARAACNAAQGLDTDTADETVVLMELAQELAREHAWRLLLDWPEQTGQAPDMASLLTLRQAGPDPFANTLEDLLRAQLLGEAPETWLARDLDGLAAWRRTGATLPARLFAALNESGEGKEENKDSGLSRIPLLPALKDWNRDMAAGLAHQALDDPAFCAAPLWHGAPAETGAWTRVRDHPMLAAWIARRGRGTGARLLARLLELAALPRRLRDNACGSLGAWNVGEGVGMAGVETSRGLLFHVVRLEDGKVADYRILAPTEWNFHPAGPLVQALTGLAVNDGLDTLARLVSRSLDPCVAFGVEIGGGEG
jgi:hypothetical protein